MKQVRTDGGEAAGSRGRRSTVTSGPFGVVALLGAGHGTAPWSCPAVARLGHVPTGRASSLVLGLLRTRWEPPASCNQFRFGIFEREAFSVRCDGCMACLLPYQARLIPKLTQTLCRVNRPLSRVIQI